MTDLNQIIEDIIIENNIKMASFYNERKLLNLVEENLA